MILKPESDRPFKQQGKTQDAHILSEGFPSFGANTGVLGSLPPPVLTFRREISVPSCAKIFVFLDWI